MEKTKIIMEKINYTLCPSLINFVGGKLERKDILYKIIIHIYPYNSENSTQHNVILATFNKI